MFRETALRRQIKPIPAGQKRERPRYRSETSWYKGLALRLREDSQFFRSMVQLAFVLLCVWIGIEFYLFMQWGASGGRRPMSTARQAPRGFCPSAR
jgi:hypothetical protein